MRADLTTRLATDADEERWNAYAVRSGARGYCFYQWKRILETAYGVDGCFTMAETPEGQIRGILAAYVNTNHRGEKSLYSLHQGLAADDTESMESLLDGSRSIARQRSVVSSTITSGALAAVFAGWKMTVKKTFVLQLQETEERTWNNLRRKTRQDINRSIRRHTDTEWGFQNLPTFYDIYVQNMLLVNAPIHSYRFFEVLAKELHEVADLIVVRRAREIISGMVVLWSPRALELVIGAWQRKHANLVPYERMFWESICRAQARGLNLIDMGESQLGSGTFNFKTNFGGEPTDVYYYDSLVGDGLSSTTGDRARDAADRRKQAATYLLAKRVQTTALRCAPRWLKRRVALRRRSGGRII